MERNQIPTLRKQLAQVDALLKRTRPETDRFQRAKKSNPELPKCWMSTGSACSKSRPPGRLLIAGYIEEVVLLDNADLLEEAV
jgi:hypothetical protein